MLGLLFIAIVAVWAGLAYALTRLITRNAPDRWYRVPIRIGLFLVVLALPFTDEIIGKFRFQSLCSDHSEVIVDVPSTQGRTVRFGANERTEFNIGVPVERSKLTMVDTNNGAPVYHYYRFEASGGWFARTVRLSEAGVPLLFRGTCQPADIRNIDRKLGLTQVDR